MTSATGKFSGSNAVALCKEVQRIETLPSPTAGENARLASCLHELAEVLVWCDKHDESACDRALDCDVMTTVERIATNAMVPVPVKVEALQFVTILLQNLTRLSSVYFVCSNNHVNRIIAMQLDEQADDDELVSTYTSFLKTLALRLDPATLQFFFDGSTLSFPLFDKAAKLLTSTDTIIGAAARQVVITIAQLQDASLTTYLESALMHVFQCVCELLQSKLHDLGAQIPWIGSRASQSQSPLKLNMRALNGDVEDALDDVYYLNDMLAVTPASITAAVVDLVARQLLHPMRLAIDRELRRRGGEEAVGVGITDTHPFLEGLSSETILAFLVRWLGACDVNSLFSARIATVFTGADDGSEEGGKGRGGGVLGGVLRSAWPELYGNAVRLLHLIMQRTLLPLASDTTVSTATACHNERPPLLVLPHSLLETAPSASLAFTTAEAAAAPLMEYCHLATTQGTTHTNENGAWVIGVLVSALRESLRQPSRNRLATVALLLQELRRILSHALMNANGAACHAHTQLWSSLLAWSADALLSHVGGTTPQHHDGEPGTAQDEAEPHDEEMVSLGWLGPARAPPAPLEKVYLTTKAEDARAGAAIAALLAHEGCASRPDPACFVPALPQQHLCTPFSEAPAASTPITRDTWNAVRTAVKDGIEPCARVPLGAAEVETMCARAWLLLRAAIVQQQQEAPHADTADSLRDAVVGRDPFVAYCVRTRTSATALQTLSLDELELSNVGELRLANPRFPQTHGLCCELAGERYSSSTRLHMASPGTPMQLAWSENETLCLVKLPRSANSHSNVTTMSHDEMDDAQSRTVLFALDVDFVEATPFVSTPFKVVVGYNPPVASEGVEIYVVLRSGVAARQCVKDIVSLANAHRQAGAELLALLCVASCA